MMAKKPVHLLAPGELVDGDSLTHYISRLFSSIDIYKEASIAVESVRLDAARCVVSSISRSRITRAKELLDAFHQFHISPFLPTLVEKCGKWRLIPPPIVEIGEQVIFIDGSHRAYAAWSRNINAIDALTIRPKLRHPHLQKPVAWADLVIGGDPADWRTRFQGENFHRFRPVTELLDAEGRFFNSVSDNLAYIRNVRSR